MRKDTKTLNLLSVENCFQYDTIHNFSVWLSSNPTDINRFRSSSETVKKMYIIF